MNFNSQVSTPFPPTRRLSVSARSTAALPARIRPPLRRKRSVTPLHVDTKAEVHMSVHPPMEDKLSSAEYTDRARSWASLLERKEAWRASLSIKQARVRVARRIGIAPGTLENLRKGRIKQIAAHTYEWLKAAVENEYASEIRAHEHELQILKQTGSDPRGCEVAEVETQLAKIRQALGK